VEVYFVPFQNAYLVYRPLRQLAFVANEPMVRYIRQRLQGAAAREGEPEDFLASLGFWDPDPPPPAPWEPADEHLPTMAVLLMTNACNLRCTYCYAKGGEGPVRAMSEPLAQRVIQTACENAVSRNVPRFALAFHGGGEPTMNWRVLRSAVDCAETQPLPCDISMATNGMWTDEQRDFIIGHFQGLSLSLDGIQAVQDVQRPRADGRGSFTRVAENLRVLEESRLHYGVRMTATMESVARLAESVAWLCEQTRAAVIQVEPCYASVRGEYSDPTPAQAEAFVGAFLAAFEVGAKAGRCVFYSGARPWTLTASFCKAPEEALIVTPDGDVVTCFETHDRRHPLTEHFVIGHATPERIVLGPGAIQAFAVRQRTRRAACQGCFCYWHCGADCASRCLMAPQTGQVRCQVNRAITLDLLAWYVAAGNGVWRGSTQPVPWG